VAVTVTCRVVLAALPRPSKLQTIAFQASDLYAVNARFGTTDPQPARYDVVRVG
jgi:hypothetical protein